MVALFAGQFKSVLACRECGYESARFEPFMFLQVCLFLYFWDFLGFFVFNFLSCYLFFLYWSVSLSC